MATRAAIAFKSKDKIQISNVSFDGNPENIGTFLLCQKYATVIDMLTKRNYLTMDVFDSQKIWQKSRQDEKFVPVGGIDAELILDENMPDSAVFTLEGSDYQNTLEMWQHGFDGGKHLLESGADFVFVFNADDFKNGDYENWLAEFRDSWQLLYLRDDGEMATDLLINYLEQEEVIS